MKKLCIILACALVISLAVLGAFLLQGQTYRYSPHRWHEGGQDKVIWDVMENYVYPGASMADVIDLLGDGSEAEPGLIRRIRQFGEWQDSGDDATTAKVLVYNIRRSGGVEDYFAVVFRGDTVVQTMLISDAE